MAYRILINNELIEEQATTKTLSISSRCPQAWLFVDLETGEVWGHIPKGMCDFYLYGQAQINADGDIVIKRGETST